MVVMKTEMRTSNYNKIKSNEELRLVILSCKLLYVQNDGGTVPYLCLMV
jgi:hypothetical protein